MEIKKVVNLETLTPEEKESVDSGLKTEADLLAEHEEAETQKQKEKDEAFEKANKKASDQEIRAKKAEEALKGKEVTPKNDSISQLDLYALIKENVPQEDIGFVTGYATLNKISIADALKSTEVKAVLGVKAEERKTAEATNTGAARRGSVQISGDTLISKASRGELPESDEDLDRLIEARLSQKGKK